MVAVSTAINSWQKRKLGEMADEVRDLFEPLESKQFPYIGLEHIEQGTLQLSGRGNSITTVSTKKQFKSGEILFGSLRPYFRKVVRPKFDGVCSTDITVIRPKPNCSPGFIQYLVASEAFIALASNISSGTRMPRANWNILCQSEWPFPPLPIQRKIAAVLSAYDDLIENNLRRIKLLEEMAQGLYREWFVKFRFPDHQNARFVDSPLGRIPEGWGVTSLGEHLNALESGKRPKGGIKDRQSGIPSVGAENVRRIGQHNFQSEKYVPQVFFECMRKGIVKDGDVALYKDGAYIGRSSYFRDGFPYTEFCVNEHVFLLRTNGKTLTQNYLYLWLQEPDSVSVIRATNGNAAQPGINQVGVKGLTLVLPEENTVQDFDRLVETNMGLIINLAKKNATLRRTRDLLLPRLISGALDVSSLPLPTAAAPRAHNGIRRYGFIERIAALPFVAKIVLFGSRARGDHDSRSDIDLAIFCATASEEEWWQVLDCLEEDRIDTLLKVDCIRFDAADGVLKENVMDEGKTLYEKSHHRANKKKPTGGNWMSEIKLATRIQNADKSLHHLEIAASIPLDQQKMNLNATIHRFNIAFETLMKALDAYLDEVLELPEEQRSGVFQRFQSAYKNHLIDGDDEAIWLAIRKARNATVHEYDEAQALELYQRIKSYVPYLRQLLERIKHSPDATS